MCIKYEKQCERRVRDRQEIVWRSVEHLMEGEIWILSIEHLSPQWIIQCHKYHSLSSLAISHCIMWQTTLTSLDLRRTNYSPRFTLETKSSLVLFEWSNLAESERWWYQEVQAWVQVKSKDLRFHIGRRKTLNDWWSNRKTTQKH